ncbi:unnamed protein product [Penicillium nalgiovense]|nr:unnamed protein product [Penicillium nalgiovense]CAG7975918.1 unnamed protein product [Penicillium nalgiovense]CAG8016504.1 unnamed protein product [Penicillium nalgiovense]CAG8022738.1 unnamed protein product [Penicillium nalgiovense]CAG8030742.1 unnamed protein product [Penicillium nalgiovense]
MDHTDKRKASFCDLPQEILESIAMNLYLPDYLHFRALCRWTWSLFGCSALVPILKKFQTLKNDTSEVRYEDCQFRCHYISRGHILSHAYRKNGSIPKVDNLAQLGASLKHIPCGDMVERAARSHNYKKLLSWLIDHGASFREVQGGIDRLCCEAYEQGDFERFRWLFSKGASLDVLAEVVFDFSGCHRPRSREACRYHLLPLKRALREGAKPSGSHEALTAELRLRRRKGLGDGRRKPIS